MQQKQLLLHADLLLLSSEEKGKENQLLLAQRERDGMIDLFRFQACCQQGQVASQEGAMSTTES